MSGKNLFLKAFSILLLAVMLVLPNGSVQPVQAAGTVNTCSQSALSAAIGSGGTVTFAVECKTIPVVLSTEILITGNTTINANGFPVQISGGNATRLFNVAAGASLTLNGLHITGGKSGGNEGGAILSAGTLIVNNTSFTNNTSLGGNGGAIYNNGGVVEITNSTFSGNVTHGTGNSGMGGAIYSHNGTTTVTNSTISGNGAQSNGGGGIYVRQKSGTAIFTVRNTILLNNQGNNCGVSAATITDGGGNISYNTGTTPDTSCLGFSGVNPLLTSLGEYDSLMPLFALQAASPAINKATANCPATDQRGVPRSTPTCDSGSYEFRYSTTTTVTSSANPIVFGDSVTFHAVVTPAAVSGMVRFYAGTMQLGSGLISGGEASYTTTYLGAGDYLISAVYAGDASYEISTGLMDPVQTVQQAPLQVKAVDKFRLFGADNPDFDFTVTGFRNGETASVFSTWPVCSTTATPDSPMGPYPIVCSGGVAQNYSFGYTDGVLTITGHLLTVTANNQTRPYGTDNPEFTYSITGFVGGDDIEDVLAKPTCSTTNMTSRTSPVTTTPYEIVCSGGLDETYSFNYLPGGLTITPVTATVTAHNQTRAYGASDPTYTYSATGFIPGETDAVLTQNPVCVPSATATSPVGSSYTIDCIGATAQNYIFNYVPGQLSITRADLTIVANNLSRAYGAANPTLTVSYTGFANGETAAVLTSPAACQTTALVTSTVAGGPYPITCSGAAAANYTIHYTPGALTVTPALLTARADNKSKGHMEDNPPLTYTISGYVNGETAAVVSGAPELATNASKTSPGGDYPILITIGTLHADNYSFQFVDGVMSILQYKVSLPIVYR